MDALVVANGHNDEPKWPDPPYPGEFAGRQLHALDYGTAEDHRGQHVLVVGMGNSAMDIATDLSYTAERTLLSVRHGSWVIPKRLMGHPADQVIKPWVAVHVPWRVRQPISQFLLRVTVGPPERYGLPAPERGLFQDHPTITDTVPSRISHGAITPKPAIEGMTGSGVRFVDGSEERVDAIVWCTGYRVAMPFLDPELVGPDPREIPLYKRIFHLERDDLFFVGLDAVHRLRLPDRGAPGPAARRPSDRRLGSAVRSRRCAPTASAAAGVRSAAGGRVGGPACGWTSTATCTSWGRSCGAGSGAA